MTNTMEIEKPPAPRVKPMARSKITNGGGMLNRIDGRTHTGRRLRDILNGLMIEFPDLKTQGDLMLLKATAGLAVLSEELQAQLVRGELLDIKRLATWPANSGATSRTCAAAQTSVVHHLASIHEHLAAFGTRLNDDQDDEDEEETDEERAD